MARGGRGGGFGLFLRGIGIVDVGDGDDHHVRGQRGGQVDFRRPDLDFPGGLHPGEGAGNLEVAVGRDLGQIEPGHAQAVEFEGEVHGAAHRVRDADMARKGEAAAMAVLAGGLFDGDGAAGGVGLERQVGEDQSDVRVFQLLGGQGQGARDRGRGHGAAERHVRGETADDAGVGLGQQGGHLGQVAVGRDPARKRAVWRHVEGEGRDGETRRQVRLHGDGLFFPGRAHGGAQAGLAAGKGRLGRHGQVRQILLFFRSQDQIADFDLGRKLRPGRRTGKRGRKLRRAAHAGHAEGRQKRQGETVDRGLARDGAGGEARRRLDLRLVESQGKGVQPRGPLGHGQGRGGGQVEFFRVQGAGKALQGDPAALARCRHARRRGDHQGLAPGDGPLGIEGGGQGAAVAVCRQGDGGEVQPAGGKVLARHIGLAPGIGACDVGKVGGHREAGRGKPGQAQARGGEFARRVLVAPVRGGRDGKLQAAAQGLAREAAERREVCGLAGKLAADASGCGVDDGLAGKGGLRRGEPQVLDRKRVAAQGKSGRDAGRFAFAPGGKRQRAVGARGQIIGRGVEGRAGQGQIAKRQPVGVGLERQTRRGGGAGGGHLQAQLACGFFAQGLFQDGQIGRRQRRLGRQGVRRGFVAARTAEGEGLARELQAGKMRAGRGKIRLGGKRRRRTEQRGHGCSGLVRPVRRGKAREAQRQCGVSLARVVGRDVRRGSQRAGEAHAGQPGRTGHVGHVDAQLAVDVASGHAHVGGAQAAALAGEGRLPGRDVAVGVHLRGGGQGQGVAEQCRPLGADKPLQGAFEGQGRAGKRATELAGRIARGVEVGRGKGHGSGLESVQAQARGKLRLGQGTRGADVQHGPAGQGRVEERRIRQGDVGRARHLGVGGVDAGLGRKRPGGHGRRDVVQEEVVADDARASGQADGRVVPDQTGGRFGQKPLGREGLGVQGKGGQGVLFEGNGQSHVGAEDVFAGKFRGQPALPGVEGTVAGQADGKGSGVGSGQGGGEQAAGRIFEAGLGRQPPGRVVERAGEVDGQRLVAVQARGARGQPHGPGAGFRQPALDADDGVLAGEFLVQDELSHGQPVHEDGRQMGKARRPFDGGRLGRGRQVRGAAHPHDARRHLVDHHPAAQQGERRPGEARVGHHEPGALGVGQGEAAHVQGKGQDAGDVFDARLHARSGGDAPFGHACGQPQAEGREQQTPDEQQQGAQAGQDDAEPPPDAATGTGGVRTGRSPLRRIVRC